MSSSPTSSSSSEPEPPELPRLFVGMLDVVCPIDIVLGSGKISVGCCLALRPQTILPLNESAGEDLQVRVNGVTLARGEVLIVADSTALRITEIVSDPSAGEAT